MSPYEHLNLSKPKECAVKRICRIRDWTLQQALGPDGAESAGCSSFSAGSDMGQTSAAAWIIDWTNAAKILT